MTTPLEKPVRRAVLINGEPYVVTIEQDVCELVRKGHRKGIDVAWEQILGGEVALAAQLAGSLVPPEDAAPASARPQPTGKRRASAAAARNSMTMRISRGSSAAICVFSRSTTSIAAPSV
jgi:hypothetical protein